MELEENQGISPVEFGNPRNSIKRVLFSEGEDDQPGSSGVMDLEELNYDTEDDANRSSLTATAGTEDPGRSSAGSQNPAKKRHTSDESKAIRSRDKGVTNFSKQYAYQDVERERNRTLRTMSATILHKAHEVQQKTRAKVFVKILGTTGRNESFHVKFGENFLHPDDTTDELFPLAPLRLEVVGAVHQAFSERKALEDKQSEPDPSPSTSTGSQMDLFSPGRPAKIADREKICFRCGSSKRTVNFKVFEAEMIGCSGKDEDEKPCMNWGHIDCVGFPGLNLEAIEKIVDYYCPKHVDQGTMDALEKQLRKGPQGRQRGRPTKK